MTRRKVLLLTLLFFFLVPVPVTKFTDYCRFPHSFAPSLDTFFIECHDPRNTSKTVWVPTIQYWYFYANEGKTVPTDRYDGFSTGRDGVLAREFLGRLITASFFMDVVASGIFYAVLYTIFINPKHGIH